MTQDVRPSLNGCMYTSPSTREGRRSTTRHSYAKNTKLSESRHLPTSFLSTPNLFSKIQRGARQSCTRPSPHRKSLPRQTHLHCTRLVLLSYSLPFLLDPPTLCYRSPGCDARSRVYSTSALFEQFPPHAPPHTEGADTSRIGRQDEKKTRQPKHGGQDADKETRKTKRIPWQRKGEVPDRPLEGVVARRPGKLPTAKTEEKLRSKPPRLSSGLLSLLKVEHALHTSPRKVFVSSSFAPQKKGALCPPLEECRPPSSEGLSSFCSSSGTHPAAASTTTDRTALIASIQESRIRASMQGGNIGAGEGEQEASLLLPVPVGPAYVSTPHGGWGQLRVTGGKARGRRLLMPRTSVLGAVRPMMSKVKEAVFSMLESMLVFPRKDGQPLSVLDLFSGSGALAIEALSRCGEASSALLVDSSLDCCETAAVNLRYCGMTERSRVIRASVEEFLLVPHRFFPLPDFPRFLLNQTKQLTDLKTLMVSLADCAGTKDFHGDLKEGTPFDDLSSYEHVQRRIEELKTGILRREYEYRMQQRDFHEEEFLPTCLFDLVLVTPPYTTVVYKDLIQLLLNCSIIKDDSMIVVEYPKEIGCLPRLIRSEMTPAVLVGVRNRLYGRTCVAVYVKQKIYPLREEELPCGDTGERGNERKQETRDASEGSDSTRSPEREESRDSSKSPGGGKEGKKKVRRRDGGHDEKENKRKGIVYLNETLLPETSYWYGQEKPREFVPLGIHKKQLLSEGWIERRGLADRRRRGEGPKKMKEEDDSEQTDAKKN